MATTPHTSNHNASPVWDVLSVAPFAGNSKGCKLKHKIRVPFRAKHCYHMGPLTRANDGTPNYDPDGKLKCSDAEECPAYPKIDFVLGEPTVEFLTAINVRTMRRSRPHTTIRSPASRSTTIYITAHPPARPRSAPTLDSSYFLFLLGLAGKTAGKTAASEGGKIGELGLHSQR